MDRLTTGALGPSGTLRPSGEPGAPGASGEPLPVLVDVATLAAWVGHPTTAATEATETSTAATVARQSQRMEAGPPTALRHGFVPRAWAPGPGALRILDVRWTALSPDTGHGDYLDGHLPDAVYVSMDEHLAGQGDPSLGRHPLPDPERFGETVRLLGLNDGDTVVVYDDAHGTSAARAWWLLGHAGIERTFLLDGGLGAWRAAGLPLQGGAVTPVPGTARTRWGGMPVLDMDAAAQLPEQGLLLDARAGERYRGETEPLDPVAGHIPGAVSAPTTQNVDDDGRFRPAAELAERFRSLGAVSDGPLGAYCGSGVTAAHQVVALNIAGYHAALFPGSWSAWSNTPGRPVATGPTP